jgi:hypothetical protein
LNRFLSLALLAAPACWWSEDRVLGLYDGDSDGFPSELAADWGETGPFDCDDGAPSSYPGADEICDALDNDCDDVADEEAVDAQPYALDSDGDGYGSEDTTVSACAPPTADHVEAASFDCDESNPAFHPGAEEVCSDGAVDEDCDGRIDEADDSLTPPSPWYVDADGDGYGQGAGETSTQPICSRAGFALNDDDCDDSNAAIHPETRWPPDVDDDAHGDADEPETVWAEA